MGIKKVKRVSKIWGEENNEVAFLFSCPGKEEYDADQLAKENSIEEKKRNSLVKGDTGDNLEIILSMLYKYNKKIFKYRYKEGYRITNASDIVHYKANGNGSEAGMKEIKASDNLARLLEDLRGYRLIIAFGRKANKALALIEEKLVTPEDGREGRVKIIKDIRHLSFPSINQIKLKSPKGPQYNTKMRLKIVCKEIIQKLKEESIGR